MFLVLIKATILSIIFLYVSYIDIKTRIIPNCTLIPIVLCGFININLQLALTGALIVSLPMLLLTYRWDIYGGGDIKLMAAIGFSLGYPKIVLAALLGLTVFYLVHYREKNQSFPMAPAICFGAFLSQLLYLVGGY